MLGSRVRTHRRAARASRRPAARRHRRQGEGRQVDAAQRPRRRVRRPDRRQRVHPGRHLVPQQPRVPGDGDAVRRRADSSCASAAPSSSSSSTSATGRRRASSTSTSSGRRSGCATSCSSTRPAWPRCPRTCRERTQRFLATDEEGPGDADAVIYLMRHLHPMDLSFLEAFKDSIATIGRDGELDRRALPRRRDRRRRGTNAMAAAERIAERYRTDPRINSLCQVVIPVAGLIAQAATTLRQDEANALRAIALLDRSRSTELLLSAPALRRRLDAPPGLEPEVRGRLLDRLGLFGVRLAVELIIAGRVNSAGELAARARGAQRHPRAAPGARRPLRLAGAGAQGPLDAGDGLGARRAARRVRGPHAPRPHPRHRARRPPARRDPAAVASCAAARSPSATTALEARRILGDGGAAPDVRLGPAGRRRRPTTSAPRPSRRSVAGGSSAEDPLLGPDARDVVPGVIRSCEALAVAGS